MEERREEKREKHLAAIGAVAAAWSLLEALIDTASIRVANITPEIGICFTAQIAGSARKLDAYIALARLSNVSKTIIDDLIAFARKTNGLSLMRNRVVHDVWVFDALLQPQRLEVTAKQVSKIEAVNMSTNEVLAFADRIDRHIVRFEKISLAVQAQSSPPRGQSSSMTPR